MQKRSEGRGEKATGTVKTQGVRAQAKKASQDKIVLAARKLFAEQGYDSATLRQIATAAGLGLATLFNHIRDKRDLIYLIFDEEVDTLTDKALAAPRPWQSFVEKILMITEPHYRLFAGEPILSRILLSEVLQQSPGPHLERHLAIRARLIKGIENLVAEAQASGELRRKPEADVIARNIFFAFSGAARWWIAFPNPDWRSGQREFELALEIMIEGLKQQSADTATNRVRAVRNSRSKSAACQGIGSDV
jgi:AcrR family transcriptional regulator